MLSLFYCLALDPLGASRLRAAATRSTNGLADMMRLQLVTDDFIGRLVTDKTLGRFFGGASDNSKMRIRQLVLDQLCAATGGPCVYIGRDMKTSHKGLGITEEDWNIAVKHLVATMTKFKVTEKEQKEVAARSRR